MEMLLAFLVGGAVGWTVRSFVSIPEGQVMPSKYGQGGRRGAAKPLRGRIISCDPKGHAAPDGLSPMAGYASDPLTLWCYELADGETAGDIAAAITGEEARYQELVLTNPTVPTVGTPGRVGGDEWNFAPGGLPSGAKLWLPQTWNPWIDQTAMPRGYREPFADDRRVAAVTHGDPILPQHSSAADLMPLQPHEPAPYGRAFTYARPQAQAA